MTIKSKVFFYFFITYKVGQKIRQLIFCWSSTHIYSSTEKNVIMYIFDYKCNPKLKWLMGWLVLEIPQSWLGVIITKVAICAILSHIWSWLNKKCLQGISLFLLTYGNKALLENGLCLTLKYHSQTCTLFMLIMQQ